MAEEKKYVITKGEHQGYVGTLIAISSAGDYLIQFPDCVDDESFLFTPEYVHEVPELGDKVEIEEPVEFTVIERFKAGEPFVKIEGWVRADKVSKI